MPEAKQKAKAHPPATTKTPTKKVPAKKETPAAANQLFYGDCLDILRNSIKDESVDLIYLDPPFNSSATYNVLFKSPEGHAAHAQIEAFEDTWHWGEQAEREFAEILHQPKTDVAEMMQALRRFLGENDMMAYLTMMANRLLELHRVLRSTGSLYLHCDPTASHYLKVVLDGVFGGANFRNEIVWKRTTSHNDARHQFPDVSDTIFFYTKSDEANFSRQFGAYDQTYLDDKYRHKDQSGRVYRLSDLRSPHPRPNLMYEYKGHKPHPNGWAVSLGKMKELDAKGLLEFPKKQGGRIQLRRYLDERAGMPITNIWDDIRPINAMAQERLGYPTQKPLALLERIISASSNEGDIVLDPFCGCGTAVHAAEKLKRRWVGIDITHLAISLIEKRMRDAFPGISFEIHGTPKDAESATDLAKRDKYQFQWWACSLVNAQPYQGKKRGADTGIDGLIYFQDDAGPPKKIIVSVKGGENVGVAMIRDLAHVVKREKAEIGLFVTLAEPSDPMKKEATKEGFYTSPQVANFPRLQILTIEGLLEGREQARYPDLARGGHTFKKAQLDEGRADQKTLF
jgi:adenine specific DNA methylase Mod